MASRLDLRFDLRHGRIFADSSTARFVQMLHHELFERVRLGFGVHRSHFGFPT
jgi:hypothetical protein